MNPLAIGVPGHRLCTVQVPYWVSASNQTSSWGAVLSSCFFHKQFCWYLSRSDNNLIHVSHNPCCEMYGSGNTVCGHGHWRLWVHDWCSMVCTVHKEVLEMLMQYISTSENILTIWYWHTVIIIAMHDNICNRHSMEDHITLLYFNDFFVPFDAIVSNILITFGK